jgi:hypothetical protein
LDRSHSEYLTESDLVAFLGAHDSMATETDVQRLIALYTSDRVVRYPVFAIIVGAEPEAESSLCIGSDRS